MYDPKQFLGKRVYNDSELELLRTTVACKTLTEAERYSIMEQAVAPCPEITMIIKGQKVRALLDMGSQVTLMNESFFLQNIQQLLPTEDKDHLNAHKLFNLKGVEDAIAIVYAVNVFFVTYKVSQVSVCNATSLTCFSGSLCPKIPS